MRGRLRNLEREAAVSLVVVEHEDGKTSCFREDEVFPDCFLHEMERGERHFAGEQAPWRGPSVRRSFEERHESGCAYEGAGTMVGHFLGENEIIHGVRERPGPAIGEISSGVYE